MLGNYAWYTKNSNELVQPVGTKKPNDFGLFDVQGNVLYMVPGTLRLPIQVYRRDKAVDDKEESQLVVISTDSRVLRGGSFLDQASIVRSAYRYTNVPTNR